MINYLIILLFILVALFDGFYKSIIIITFHNLLVSYNQINIIIFSSSIVLQWINIYDVITIGTLIYQVQSNYKSIINFLNFIDFDQKVDIYISHKKSYPNHTLIIFESYIKYKKISKILEKKFESFLGILKEFNHLMEKLSISYCIHLKKIEHKTNKLINNKIIHMLDIIGIKKYFEEYIHNHKIFTKINEEFINRELTNTVSDNVIIKNNCINNNQITSDNTTVSDKNISCDLDYAQQRSQTIDCQNFPPGLLHPLNKSCPSLIQHTKYIPNKFKKNDTSHNKEEYNEQELHKVFEKELMSEFKHLKNTEYNNLQYTPEDEEKLNTQINEQLKQLDNLSKMFHKLS